MVSILTHIESTTLRLCFSIIFIILFLMFLLPTFMGIVNLGNIAGIIFSIMGFYIFAFNEKFSKLIDILSSKNIGKVILNAISIILLLCILLAIIISGMMIFKMNNHPSEPNNIIVLGCKVQGTKPS